ncbi:transposable element Tcb1 transposase [Trichonephila clavipes]|nr:transposable element Tcb1 transposase [Trichonephila clavipes]
MARVWGGIILGSRTDLHVQSVKMTGHSYRDVILEQHICLFQGAMGAEFLYMGDNNHPHCANIVDECFQQEDITRMDWPASPDLNPREHAWNMLCRRIAARQNPPTYLSEIRRALLDEWCNITRNQIDNLKLSMPRRCKACIASSGRQNANECKQEYKRSSPLCMSLKNKNLNLEKYSTMYPRNFNSFAGTNVEYEEPEHEFNECFLQNNAFDTFERVCRRDARVKTSTSFSSLANISNFNAGENSFNQYPNIEENPVSCDTERSYRCGRSSGKVFQKRRGNFNQGRISNSESTVRNDSVPQQSSASNTGVLSEAVKCLQCRATGLNLSCEENCSSGAVELDILCDFCSYSYKFCSSKKCKAEIEKPSTYEINTRLAYAMRCIGKGAEAARMFCGIMNLPPPPTKFSKYNKMLLCATKDVCDAMIKDAVEEAVQENQNIRHSCGG